MSSNAKRKIYHVWLEMHVEEENIETGEYRDVMVVDGRVVREIGTEEDIRKLNTFDEAQAAIDFKDKLLEEFDGRF